MKALGGGRFHDDELMRLLDAAARHFGCDPDARRFLEQLANAFPDFTLAGLKRVAEVEGIAA